VHLFGSKIYGLNKLILAYRKGEKTSSFSSVEKYLPQVIVLTWSPKFGQVVRSGSAPKITDTEQEE